MTDRYFTWLCDQVAPNRGSPGCKSYSKLFQILHSKRYYSLVEHDENRGLDGMVLRDEFAVETGFGRSDIPTDGPTLLEVMVYLARRIVFEMDGIIGEGNTTSRWFWEMIRNLKLEEYTDEALNARTDLKYRVDDILERLLSRSYTETGVGGLFPLWKEDQDQRQMEVWMQCQQYLYERYQKDILG